jgi:hypothetical protein
MKFSELSDKDFLFPDTSWFDNEPDRYFAMPQFQEFQRITGVDLHSLLSSEPMVLAESQRRLVNQSLIMSEVQKEHAGFAFPFIVYTHCLDLFDAPPSHNIDVDKFILGFDMTDSLRRRHIALSHFIVPAEIRRLQADIGKPISIHWMSQMPFAMWVALLTRSLTVTQTPRRSPSENESLPIWSAPQEFEKACCSTDAPVLCKTKGSATWLFSSVSSVVFQTELQH